MQSQQEQQVGQNSTVSYSSYSNVYGRLIKLNFFAIAGFAIAFLLFEEEARWMCAIGLFLCVIFVFVLNALSQQYDMIQFQNRQIQDLLAQQQTILHQINRENERSVQSHIIDNKQVYEVETGAEHSTIFTPRPSIDELAEDTGLETLPTEPLEHPLVDISQSIAEQQQENTLVMASEAIPQQEGILATSSTIASEPSAIHSTHSYSTDTQSSEANSSNTNQSNQGTLLKDLKGMTSLWSAGLEWFKGGNSIVRIAIVILLIGVILLLRFASEYWQPTLGTKMVGIAVAGSALTAIGYWLRNRRYGYAISLQGAGLGVLFLVLFSTFKLGVITSIGLSYGLLIALLALTLLLALRQNALILAFIALGSGFVAPFILNTGSNNIPALFSYYLALNIALAVIAFFKPWRILNTVSLLATFGVGGLSIWLKAQPEQYTTLTVLVWLHFALYLFISIRYSQNIAQYKIAFKNIPLIDTALIFATPFMAFTLYAGLVYHNQSALSLASAVLALVYFVMGYVLHKKSQALTLLIQSFYGLGLTFLALILPFAFNAQWTSTGWAVQALALIWIGSRHHLKNSVLYGLVLLACSSVFWLKSIIFDFNYSVLAVCFLALAYLSSAYIFSTAQLTLTASEQNEIDEHGQISLAQSQMNQGFFERISQTALVACLILLNVVVGVYCAVVFPSAQYTDCAILMAVLTLASVVLAGRMYSIQQISPNMQLFAGIGLFYFAMIPLILWQADRISIWWSIQAFVMLIATIRFAMPTLRNMVTLLMLASAGTSIYAIADDASLRYVTATLIVLFGAFSAYGLWYKVQPKALGLDRLCAGLNIGLSFLFVPYLVIKLSDMANIELFSIALPMLLWWCVLTSLYRFKQPILDQAWLTLSILLLFIGATEVPLLSYFNSSDLQLWMIASKYQVPLLFTIILWCVVFVFCLKVFAKTLNQILFQFFTCVAVLLLATSGGLLAWNSLAFVPLLLVFPVGLLLASLKVPQLQFLQQYWVKNLAIVAMGLICLWWVSLFDNGLWNLSYITLFNPIDLLSIGIFALIIFAIKPVLENQQKEIQLPVMAVLIITGMMLLSSILLLSLYHYQHLPYWSMEAWQNGTVQASLTILWVILALVLTTFASKKALRYVWMLGIAVLALVIAKLIFLDLSHTHTITRIVSFIGSGLVMLVIGYFAPLPPESKDVNDPTNL